MTTHFPVTDALKVVGTSLSPADTREVYRQKLARITLDSMVQFVGLLDANGTVLEINKVALDAVGITLADVEGKPFWTTFWWQVSDAINATLRASIAQAASGEFVRWDAEIYGRAGGKETIIIDASLQPVKDEHGNVVFIAAEGRDITEKKAQERVIAQKNEELQGLLLRIKELDEIKSQFFANVSHELRTPLSLILGPAERLLDPSRVMSNHERMESSRVIARNARLLLKHVNDLLDISKLEAGKLRIVLQNVDVAELVRFTASHFDVLAQSKQVRFEIAAPEKLLAAIDASKLQRVLMNLLSNAFKFTPDRGRILCSLHADNHGSLVIAIDDSGPGVAPDQRQLIFDRFRQADGGSNRRFGGTGLGLAIAKEFVELHRGTIAAAGSTLGGARFEVSLPQERLQDSAGTDHAIAANALEPEFIQGFIDELHPGSVTDVLTRPADRKRRPTVLVVEDNPAMNRFIAQSLADSYDVRQAFDGRQGLQMAVDQQPMLIVTDIMMPHMSGAEMIVEIRKQELLRETPILLLSAKADDELKNRLLMNGAQDFVEKPFTERELQARVANLISVRQATVEAVLARQELHDFFMQAPMPMMILRGPEHRFSLVNPSYEKLLGRKMLGRTLREIFTETEVAQIVPIMDRVYRTGEQYVGKDVRLDIADPDGAMRTRCIDLTYYPFRAQDGAVEGIMVIVVDVTSQAQVRRELQTLNETLESKVAERTAELASSEQQFQQLVAGVADVALYMLDRRGVVISWNPGAERIKGYTAKEIIGQHFSRFYVPEDQRNGMPAQALETAVQHGKYDAEAWRVRKDGTRFWASVLIDPIHRPDGEIIGFAKITRDMTEKRAMQEQLHQSQKMEAIGQLTGGVAHDFNNLLTVIIGNLETLSRKLPAEDGRLRRAIDQATQGAQRAATLTSQLLAFSRRQPLNPKPTDVNRLVVGMSALMRRTIGENIAIDPVFGSAVWPIDVDQHHLESALLNLAVNSRDAMPGGGRLVIETSNEQIDERDAMAREVAPGDYVAIRITDNGVGMSDEVITRAFDPFFTTKPLGQGTGLGLSQVFGFVRQSGGTIRLTSNVGQGTSVTIFLPRSADAEPANVSEPAASMPVGSDKETILVVEDDDGVRAYSIDSLRDLGFTVIEASSGAQALQLLEQHRDISLLFTDVGLPGMNGSELVTKVRERRPGLKVLFTSGYARDTIVQQGRLERGVELLNKPFTLAQLAARVREVLDRVN